MAAYTSKEIYDVATVRLKAPHTEALIAAQNAPKIEDLMKRNKVPVESAIFSFLTEHRIRQDEASTEKKQSGGWRGLFRR